ncbi:hypothetical protein DDV93_22385 [Cereibacter johrii]|nr:hypothetical protein DDV93_22385 [Cereibacter johrii]
MLGTAGGGHRPLAYHRLGRQSLTSASKRIPYSMQFKKPEVDLFMPKAVTSLTGFIRKIEQTYSSASGDLFYRGHPDLSYKLTPSIFRTESFRSAEKNIIYRAMSESPKEFDGDQYFFDKLVRAQHYGIPTRLLDLTINPLIALFFACEKNPTARSQVVVLEVPKGDAKFFLSDAVSCKANLAQLTDPEAQELFKGVIST